MTDAPDRIFATVNGRKTRIILGGETGGYLPALIGGWCAHRDKYGATEYVRADLHAATVARAEKAEAALAEAQFERDNNRAKLEVKKREYIDASAAKDRAEALLREAVEAIGAIIERWDSPSWKDAGPTGDVINRARAILARLTGDA